MGIVDVVHSQSDLRTRGGLLLGRIESKMKVSPLLPRNFCVLSSDPPVVNLVVARMEIDAESFPVEIGRSVQVGHLQDDRHEPTMLGHLHSSRNRLRLTLCPQKSRLDGARLFPLWPRARIGGTRSQHSGTVGYGLIRRPLPRDARIAFTEPRRLSDSRTSAVPRSANSSSPPR